MSTLSLNTTNVHDVTVDDRRILFHIPTTSLFDLDHVGADVLDLFKERGNVAEKDIVARFDGRYDPGDVVETIRHFVELGILGDGAAQSERAPLKIENFPLSTVILNVTTGCNLGCSYCYKEDLMSPAAEQRMDLETAKQSIDMLFREGESRDRLNVVFFGGEPLSNFGLIRQVVDYAERRGAEANKTVDFTMTTNATLLTGEIVDYLNAHRFGIAVSIDGPKAVHDRHRVTVGGQGTYDVVAEKTRDLLKRYTARPIGARVTVTAGATDVISIHDHLINDMGFFEVGFAPVTSGENEIFKLNGAELTELFENMKALGEIYCEAAIEGRNIGFSNMHQLMTDLYEGNKKTLPCGAGVGLLAVDAEGDLNLCHRFTGSDLETYGNVRSGIAKERLGGFIEQAADLSGKGCETCRIRNLCAGGCYHESYINYDDPFSPTYLYCDLMRDWVDFGIGIYARIMAANPDFLERHVMPRKAVGDVMELF